MIPIVCTKCHHKIEIFEGYKGALTCPVCGKSGNTNSLKQLFRCAKCGHCIECKDGYRGKLTCSVCRNSTHTNSARPFNVESDRNSSQQSTQRNVNNPVHQYRNSNNPGDFVTGVAKIAIGVILGILALILL
jgi:hypothetical protein